MAERIQVELVDDIDGSPAKETVTFALDGVAYEIDLSEHHAQHLRSVFARYIEHARKPERSSRETKPRDKGREERRNRQANRQLTEQIRGAAQRTRERLKEQEAVRPSTEEQNEPALDLTPPPSPKEKPEETKETRVPAVSLPQFSSAVD